MATLVVKALRNTVPVNYHPYDLTHVIAQTQLLFFSALAFCWLKLSGLYPPELPSINIDAEWIYRKGVPLVMNKARLLGQELAAQVREYVSPDVLSKAIGASGLSSRFRTFANTWAIGTMVQWAVALLGILLLTYFVY